MKKKDLEVLLALFGVIVLVGGLFFGNSLKTKTETLKTENATLESEVAYLQDLMNHKQEYLDEMDRMNLEMDSIKEQFPADIYPENQIMYANGLEAQFDVLLEAVNMPAITGVEVAAATASQTTTDATAAQATTTNTTEVSDVMTNNISSITLSKAETTVEYQASYNGLKSMIKYLNEDKERKSVESLSVSYDTETGNLRGTIIYNMYALSGTGKEYVAPVVTGVTDGKNAIFSGATVLNRTVENRSGDAATADGVVEDNSEESAKEEAENEE